MEPLPTQSEDKGHGFVGIAGIVAVTALAILHLVTPPIAVISIVSVCLKTDVSKILSIFGK